jgi:thymidylate synthase (FAD)
VAQDSPELIKVLDNGYVRLVDHMGSDLTPVNAARVSFAKESKSLTNKDIKLINYLATHEHTSPFRHAFVSFEVHAPLMVARQWWKHVVGSDHTMEAWNESSRRYVTEDPEFYVPTEWRAAPDNKKQGSGEVLGKTLSVQLTQALMEHIELSEALYEGALEEGVCAEQARLFLPAYGMYVRWYWSGSLQAVAHFLNLRLDGHAQKEIQEYAQAVYDLVYPLFPVSIQALCQEVVVND